MTRGALMAERPFHACKCGECGDDFRGLTATDDTCRRCFTELDGPYNDDEKEDEANDD